MQTAVLLLSLFQEEKREEQILRGRQGRGTRDDSSPVGNGLTGEDNSVYIIDRWLSWRERLPDGTGSV